MRSVLKLIMLGCGLSLAACASKPISEQAITPIFKADDTQDAQRYTRFIGHPTPDKFSICLHNTCQDFAFVSLSKQQWQLVTRLFNPVAKTAQQERTQIKKAIALLEFLTGEQTVTHLDKAKNDLSNGITGQLDCIDEATNTSIYLRLIAEAGLLQWHQQGARITRGILTGNAPHTSATIVEKKSQQVFAVDAWFEANGQAPYIVPLTEWKSGWKPQS